MQNTVLQTVKVQRKVEAARMFSTWSQAPAKVRVVSDISPVIRVAHFSMQPHLQQHQDPKGKKKPRPEAKALRRS